jgi:hypothetical protein
LGRSSRSFRRRFFGKEERTIRDAHAYAYQQYGTTSNWSRYVHLGYFAFNQCSEFNKIWANIQNDPVMVHRAIWYNFQYHVERDIPMTEPLTTWAMNISHPFLEYHDAKYLDVDTVKYSTGVARTIAHDKTKTTDEAEWIQVNNKKRSQNKTTTDTANQVSSIGGILRQSNNRNGKANRKSKGIKETATKNQPPPVKNKTHENTVVDANAICENESEEEDMEIEDDSNASVNQSNHASGTLPALNEVIPPHPKIPTNDGTHRITVRWTATSDVSEFEKDKNRLNEALYTLMTTLFHDTDGVFYKWESEDMLETKAASSLSQATARDFVSPKVTFIASRSMMVFGIRFGFLSSPGNWQHSEHTKTILKEQHLNVLVSNSKSTSGDLVTAGYILLKAPNTTHRHYYTQYLRSKIPEATPYFDIIRFKKTPMDQAIPHLVVQCGEKHVTPVCKALLSILTGKASALFLPRYAFRTMPHEQIKRHFDVHHNWSRSLKPIQLPKISHIDQQRVEYFDNGTILKRSTREWAHSLNLANGQTAHCDAVNGGSDRKAFLACPNSYFAQAQKELQQYRSRLNPPSHREARYVESVSGLPDMSNISIEIEPNVSILDKLSAAAIWTQAPASVRDSGSKQGRRQTRNKNRQTRTRSSSSNRSNDLSATTRHTHSDAEDSMDDSANNISGNTTNDESESGSTASTAATSTAPQPDPKARFRELERRIQQAQKQSDAEGQATAAKLSGIQTQFAAMEDRMSMLQATQQKLSADISQLQDHNNRNFTEIRENMLSSMEATSHVSQSMLDIRTQFTTMSQFMADLAQKMDTVLNRREGIPPEVNLTSPIGNNPNGSESSSCLGDPSQAAKSDASKTASQVSSIGKRTLAATTQGNLVSQAANLTPARPSPIKKKHRVRNNNDNCRSDHSDDDNLDDAPNIPVNLNSRFQETEDIPMNENDNMTNDVNSNPPTSTSNASTNTSADSSGKPTSSGTTAPPTHQYNNPNESAGAQPP